MQKTGCLPQNVRSLRVVLPHQSLGRLGNRCSQRSNGQQASPTVFPEKRGKLKFSKQNADNITSEDPEKVKVQEHCIDIGDEQSDLLGYEVFSGKLTLDKSGASTDVQTDIENQVTPDAKLTSRALIWSCHILHLDDVISVSYNAGVRHFTIHSYPIRRRSCGLSCLFKPQRTRKDFRFVASSVEDAVQWVSGFADQQCYVNLLPHPLVSSKKQGSIMDVDHFPPEPRIKCKSPPTVLVILNPRSGRGRSSKVFHGKVEPIFKAYTNKIHEFHDSGHPIMVSLRRPEVAGFENILLAGFKMEVVKTTSAGHARNLAYNVDFSTCPDGIICVGGDGIVNEVLNGLLSRHDQKEAISIPIGIIPAGSDNSLVWTVLGVRDPVSAAITIVKGGLTATDVFAVEWIQTGVIHFGMTVSYFGFVSDVLELSEKYQKRFGPLRYFVAGVLKFLCLPKYNFEVEYLPVSKPASGPKEQVSTEYEVLDIYQDIMRRSNTEGIPRASSLSSIDSIMTPSRMSGDLDTTCSTLASSEPSEYVRGLDPKSKRLSMGRNNHHITEPEEVIHPPIPLSTTPNWPRTRSKSRTDKGWTGLAAVNDSRTSWANTSVNDKEDISSTISDPGPNWDTEPKWDREPNWVDEHPIELPRPPEDEVRMAKEVAPKLEEKWVVKKGHFLGVLVCNHSCKTVQSLSSQVIAPQAEFDDNTLDLLLVHGSGRLRLLRFFLRLQFGQHLSLPYVEYVKVKSVKLKAGKNTHNGCGIDGELLSTNGQVISSLLPEQCRLIGRPANERV